MVASWFLCLMYALIACACALLIPDDITALLVWFGRLQLRPSVQVHLKKIVALEILSFVSLFSIGAVLLEYHRFGAAIAVFSLGVAGLAVSVLLAVLGLHSKAFLKTIAVVSVYIFAVVACQYLIGIVEQAEDEYNAAIIAKAIEIPRATPSSPPVPGIDFKDVPFGEVAPNGLFLSPLADSFYVSFGGNVAAWAKSELTKGADKGTGIGFGDSLPIYIYVNDKGRVTMDLSLFDISGELAVQITDSKLAISPKFPDWQKNEDAYALEIVDQHIVPVLQIERLRGDTLKIGVYFGFLTKTKSIRSVAWLLLLMRMEPLIVQLRSCGKT